MVHVADRKAEGGEAPLPEEWVIRDLRAADLDRESGVQAILNRFPFRWSPSWPADTLQRRIIPADRHGRLVTHALGAVPSGSPQCARAEAQRQYRRRLKELIYEYAPARRVWRRVRDQPWVMSPRIARNGLLSPCIDAIEAAMLRSASVRLQSSA